MKKVTYVSDTSVNLGRFGVIKKGQTLEITEQEWLGIEGDARFKYTPTEYPKEVLEAASRAMPYGTHMFDLRTIPWGYKKLFTMLEARHNKLSLAKLREGMIAVGAPLRDVSIHTQRMHIVDAIIESAYLCGWCSLTKGELNALPKLEDAPKQPRKPKVTTISESGTGNTISAKPVRHRTRRNNPTTIKA